MAVPLLSGQWNTRYSPEVVAKRSASLKAVNARRREMDALERKDAKAQAARIEQRNAVIAAWEREHPGLPAAVHEQRIRQACEQAVERWRMQRSRTS